MGGWGAAARALVDSMAPAGSSEAGVGDARRAVARGGGVRPLAWGGGLAVRTPLGVATEAVAVRMGANRRVGGAAVKAPAGLPPSVPVVGGGVVTPPTGVAATRAAAAEAAGLSCAGQATRRELRRRTGARRRLQLPALPCRPASTRVC